MSYSQSYEPPTLAVDGVFFQIKDNIFEVLLIKRSAEPFKNCWALPGGYNPKGETTREALQRVIHLKSGLDVAQDLSYIEQVCAIDTVARDPRGHAVSIVYMGCGRKLSHGEGCEESQFYPLDHLPTLAYDHDEIINLAKSRLINKLGHTNIVFSLMPKKFTQTQLQTAYESILGRALDKRNFRKKFLSLDFIKETGDTWREGAHRPAKLYTFKSNTLVDADNGFDSL